MIEVPATFRAMPRWWSEGAGWLDSLPRLVDAQCERWSLVIDGPVRHGSNALVVPVRRGPELFALRLTPPGPDLAPTVRALEFWAGRGTVRLLATDPDRGALLLERLDADHSVADLPVTEALPILGRIARRLAVPAPPTVPDTGEIARAEAAGWADRWAALGRPCPVGLLRAAVAAATAVSEPATHELAVNGDLHAEQVLAGERESWLVVDPVLLRGDVGYDLGRVLWSRLDELGSAEDVRGWLGVLCEAAELDHRRAERWVLVRAMSYLLWGLDRGLTEDPPRCRRLLEIFAAAG